LRAAILLTLIVTLVRLLLVALAPYDLVGDEAHYWDWSRHLDWSYYSKGPGVAWAIWASTSLLGHTEFAVRLPTVLASAGTLLMVAWLARALFPSSKRAPFYAALTLAAVPIVHGIALLMTIDGPYVACWAWALCVSWMIAKRARRDSAAPKRALALLGLHLGLALGVGFLFKYTILLLPVSLAVFVLFSRGVSGRTIATRWLAAAGPATVSFLVCAMPVIYWNIANDSPTVRHLMGHLGMKGGDMPVSTTGGDPWSPVLPFEYLGTQIGLIGPVLVLAIASSVGAVRRLRSQPNHPQFFADLFLLCTGWTIFAVYLGVSFRTGVEGNWPVAGVVALSVLVGRDAARVLERHASEVKAWLALPAPRPKRGLLRRKPETLFQVAYHWGVGYGMGTLALFALLPIVAVLPVVGDYVPLSRITGASDRADIVQGHLDTLRADGQDPIVIATDYWLASHLAFYLDGRPTVYSATAYRGGRQSSYDDFEETDLTDPALIGRPAVLVGTHKRDPESELTRWLRSRLAIGQPVLLEPGGRDNDLPTVFLAPSFGGVVDAPPATEDND
jgi:undecaprenyl-diphosphatase